MRRLRTRQVHLDFHTSEYIPGVGSSFNKQQFQEALQLGKLNSITVFAKCHHSWCYYPTKTGHMHPTLNLDLTGAMIEAAHEIGVRAPVYIPVGWSSNDVKQFPECMERKKDGTIRMSNGEPDDQADPNAVRPIVSWTFMCPSGRYAEHIYDQTHEVCGAYPNLDGLFYDICFHHSCWCENCLSGMRTAGLDPDCDEDAHKYYVSKWHKFTLDCKRILAQYHPEATIFFNGGADLYKAEWHGIHSHIEMEDLPTHWGGYDKMPLQAKYFAKLGQDYLGMTGKFHTMWGEFGGFKSPAALRYEIAAMMSYGARCSVGDQMHPSGEMDLDTYRLIGEAYLYAELIEPWCYDVEETSRLGVMLSTNMLSNEGMTKILLEHKLDFALVLTPEDLQTLDALILPDDVLLDENWAAAIDAFAKQGGGVLLTGTSGLNVDRNRFQLDFGAEYLGASSDDCDYLQLDDTMLQAQESEAFTSRLLSSPFLCYEPAVRIRHSDGNVLARRLRPYFSRTYAHYCSHQNTPNRTEPDQPAALRKGGILYLAHPIFRMYHVNGMQLHRDYVYHALKLIYSDPVLQVTGLPSAGRARLVHQAKQRRYVLHLLYASPIQRGTASVLEDMPPIYDVKVEFRVDQPISSAYLAPELCELPINVVDNRVSCIVHKVECHQIAVFNY